jgi:hypothetical protein
LPQATDLLWRDYLDEHHDSTTELTDWIESLPPFAQSSVLGQIDALFELAASGQIQIGDEGKLRPIRRDPDLYELKWKLLSKAVRQYHAEPPQYPDDLVKLHIHIKSMRKTSAGTRAAQDMEISQAQLRYVTGESSEWTP